LPDRAAFAFGGTNVAQCRPAQGKPMIKADRLGLHWRTLIMKRALPFILALVIGFSTASPFASAQTAQSHPQDPSEAEIDAEMADLGDDDASGDDDAPPVQRVARLRMVDGDVSFLRAGVTEWAPAVENLPLLEGDQLYVAAGSRAEIQLSSGSFIKLLEETTITIAELSDAVSQFEITSGEAVFNLDRLVSGSTRFEVDAPNAAVVLTQDGEYSLAVLGADQTEVRVRRGAAEVDTADGSVRVRQGFRLAVDTSANGELQLASDTSAWPTDQWTDAQATVAQTVQSTTPDDVQSYESDNPGFYGTTDLSDHGTWVRDSSYGSCWVPRVSSGWAPYRYGQWLWIPSVGWTWQPEERWGWAPYHYGRWAFLPGRGWAWIPGFGFGGRRSHWDYRWRPALVRFYHSSNGSGRYVAWCPLTPRDRWRGHDGRNGRNRRDNNFRPLPNPNPRNRSRRPDTDERTWINPRTPRAITAVPIEAFNRPTRSINRKDVSLTESPEWLGKNIRLGLPELNPTPIAARPVDRVREGRKVKQPAPEAISRSVVTRNRPASSEVEANAPRERRLIEPRQIEVVGNGGVPRFRNVSGDGTGAKKARVKPPVENNPGGNSAGTSAGVESKKNRISLPAPVEKRREANTHDNGNNESDNPQRKAERQERKQLRKEQQPQQQSNLVSQPQNYQVAPRVRPENRPEPRVEIEKPAPRAEQRSESRAERKQEKQQRHAENRAEQRRKP
jgi:hypothetical protein